MIQSFDCTLIKTINEIVVDVFDAEVAENILQYLQQSEQTYSRIRTFSDSLNKILGVGSTIIEDLILETLYSKYNSQFKWKKDYTFIDYVLELKDQVLRRKKDED